jgi:riboflavin kinase/FMN adenylyltransferase
LSTQLRRRLAPLHEGPGYVATIGSYDGLHRGHQALLALTRAQARQRGLASLMVTFEPLPREFFGRADPPARLTSFRERWRLLQGPDGAAAGDAAGSPYGGLVDVVCVLRFCEALRRLEAPAFADLLGQAGVRHLVVGHDFRAARNGAADAAWLAAQGPAHGFSVEVVAPVLQGAERYSSRGVRAALQAGDLAAAEAQLGRPYSMRGRVRRGAQLGRELGYPTANLALLRRRPPLGGVFAVRVHAAGDDALGRAGARGWPGVASLGVRPTINGGAPLLETHLFDYNGDLYGREIEVRFVARLRDELRFDTVAELVLQMDRDAAQARALLANDEG